MNLSILFMLGMMLAVLGTFAFLVWNSYRKAGLRMMGGARRSDEA